MSRMIYFMWAFLFFYGCRTEELTPFISFDPDLKDVKHEYFNQYYCLSEVIPLETNDSSLIGDPGKVIAAGDCLFVMDRQKKGIWIFNRSGKYLNKINKPGRGPGEYVRMGDFMVDRGSRQIIIYDRMGKFNYYDWEGNFLFDKKAHLYIEHVENLPDGGWLANHGFMHNVAFRDTTYGVIASDTSMRAVAGLAPYPNLGYSVPVRITSGLFQDRGRYFAMPLTQNTIYEYNYRDKVFEPRYKFNIDNTVLPDAEKLTNQDVLNGFFKEYFMMAGEYIGKKTVWVTICRMKDGKFFHLVGDLETGKVYTMPYYLEDKQNQLSLSRDLQHTGFEGKLVFYSAAIRITSREYEGTDSEGYHLSRRLGEEDNPVLFLYEEK